jgi:hypothetical protein
MKSRTIKSISVLLMFMSSMWPLLAQEVTVRGGFFLDSLKIGDQTGFYLTAKYPSKLNIIFPDSTYNFSPFEYERKRYFPTQTIQGESYDSVVYYLSTFEVDRVQTLSLPVFQLNPQDCTKFTSPQDTILLMELVKNLPDTLTAENLPLRVNTIYENVSYLFNYPILIISIAVLLVGSIIVWFVFGKKIIQHFRLKKMLKAHQKFLDTYSAEVDAIKTAFSAVTTESALSLWKKYMENLEARPYTKLTTRETMQLENNDVLGRNLHAIDGAIYGHSTAVIESLENLKQFADQRFSKKLEEVKHG